MNLDSDLRLRLAVFDHVNRLRHEHGGVIPSARLNDGIRFDGRRVPLWNQQRGIYPEVPNGLSLCRIHHRAYDVDILGVDPDYRIHLRRDVLDEIDGPMLRHGLQELHGERIQLPRRTVMKPRRDYLEERFERFNAA